MTGLLSDNEVDTQLRSDWERGGDEIVRVYEFDDYLDGVAFATSVGEMAEKEFHHPEITIRYQGIRVRLTSHGEGGITDKDLRLADLFGDEL